MKRISILSKPTAVGDLGDIDTDNLTNTWQLKAERLQIKQLRRFKHSLA